MGPRHAHRTHRQVSKNCSFEITALNCKEITIVGGQLEKPKTAGKPEKDGQTSSALSAA